jgi:hypothetical protein
MELQESDLLHRLIATLGKRGCQCGEENAEIKKCWQAEIILAF